MKLYVSPLACSLATRIACYEAGVDLTYVDVDLQTKRTQHGTDYLAVHPLGLVPALELPDGRVLTENAAILQFLAERYPEALLAPRDPWGRARLQQWLAFIGMELHTTVFVPFLDRRAGPEVKAYALAKAVSRLHWLEAQLEGREFLLDHFTVGDAYLFAVLNWTAVTPLDLARWPATSAYHAGLKQRPSVARAFAVEQPRYLRDLALRQPLAPDHRSDDLA